MVEGDYGRRVQVDGADEIAQIARAFNTMAEEVERMRDRLDIAVAHLGDTQGQFVHAQKMEAIGRLAGGVSHDFNNLLTVILGEAGVALTRPNLDAELRAGLQQIHAAAERGAALTRQLLTFSRRQVISPKVFDVNRMVRGLERMLQRIIGENIKLTALLHAREARVSADLGQLEQVIVNLVVNARDAMPQGGSVVIETQNVELDEIAARGLPDVTPGNYIMVSVSDTGVGMSDDVRAHLFEPFFTTKPPGRGTGLGLATSYGIVRQSGGHIIVHSEPGHGASVKVYLPAARAEIEASGTAEPTATTGHERILVVEDDAAVREVTVRMLSAHGYTVFAAESGQAALDFIGRGEPIDLMVTDVVMPNMGGRELAERAQTRRPNLRVLFVSGHTDDLLRERLLGPDSAVVQKPFTGLALAHKIRELLDAPPAPIK